MNRSIEACHSPNAKLIIDKIWYDMRMFATFPRCPCAPPSLPYCPKRACGDALPPEREILTLNLETQNAIWTSWGSSGIWNIRFREPTTMSVNCKGAKNSWSSIRRSANLSECDIIAVIEWLKHLKAWTSSKYSRKLPNLLRRSWTASLFLRCGHRRGLAFVDVLPRLCNKSI